MARAITVKLCGQWNCNGRYLGPAFNDNFYNTKSRGNFESTLLTHLDHFDGHEQGEGEGGHDEQDGDHGHEMRADARALVAN